MYDIEAVNIFSNFFSMKQCVPESRVEPVNYMTASEHITIHAYAGDLLTWKNIAALLGSIMLQIRPSTFYAIS